MGTDPATSVVDARLPNASGGESLHRRFVGVSDGRRGQPDSDDRRPRSQTGRHAEEDGMKAHPRREFLLRVLAACGTPWVGCCRASGRWSDAAGRTPQPTSTARAAARLFRRRRRRGAGDWRSLPASTCSVEPTRASILEHTGERAADILRPRASEKAAFTALVSAVRRDFQEGRVLQLEGWVLSRTEVELCALTLLPAVSM